MLLRVVTAPLRAFMNRADRGLYAGKEILFGNNVSHSQRKTRRRWLPNVQVRRQLGSRDPDSRTDTGADAAVVRSAGWGRYAEQNVLQ